MIMCTTLLVVLFSFFNSIYASSDGDIPRENFAVGLTTIPPRFSSVHHVIRSWLQQDIPPAIIVIFIPKKYAMFVNGVGKNKNKNYDTLQSELQNHFATEMEEGRVAIQMVPKDLGPLTKYAGMLEFFSELDQYNGAVIDHWVIGDDDVHYTSATLTGYAEALVDRELASSANDYIMTHFKVHARLEVLLDNEIHPIGHLQVGIFHESVPLCLVPLAS
jgi:hypothetical protein